MFGEKFLKINFDSKLSKSIFWAAGAVGGAVSGGNLGVAIAIAGIPEAGKKFQEDIKRYEPTNFKDFLGKSLQNMSVGSWLTEMKSVGQLTLDETKKAVFGEIIEGLDGELGKTINEAIEDLELIDILAEEEVPEEEEAENENEEDEEEDEEDEDE
ncbi:hypothetical protein, partial [Priestia megaterium]|uniref:hypothetical protein n=1 Tax=Priestia megaterium TaxID=1404 RepID=UPI002877CE52